MGDAGPVPAGNADQHLREAAGVFVPTVETVVPQQLVVRSLQPGHTGGQTGWSDTQRDRIRVKHVFLVTVSTLSAGCKHQWLLFTAEGILEVRSGQGIRQTGCFQDTS